MRTLFYVKAFSLQQAWDAHDYPTVVNMIHKTCTFLANAFKAVDEGAVWDFEELEGLTKGEDEAIKDGEFFGFNSAYELAKARMTDLYDLADRYNVWLDTALERPETYAKIDYTTGQ